MPAGWIRRKAKKLLGTQEAHLRSQLRQRIFVAQKVRRERRGEELCADRLTQLPPCVAVAVAHARRPLASSSHPQALAQARGSAGPSHRPAASSLLSQAVPALLTPRAGSWEIRSERSHIHSTTPKPAHDFGSPDRFSFASLTSPIPGQMVKPRVLEGGDSELALHLFGSAPLLLVPHLGTPRLRRVCS